MSSECLFLCLLSEAADSSTTSWIQLPSNLLSRSGPRIENVAQTVYLAVFDTSGITIAAVAAGADLEDVARRLSSQSDLEMVASTEIGYYYKGSKLERRSSLNVSERTIRYSLKEGDINVKVSIERDCRLKTDVYFPIASSLQDFMWEYASILDPFISMTHGAVSLIFGPPSQRYILSESKPLLLQDIHPPTTTSFRCKKSSRDNAFSCFLELPSSLDASQPLTVDPYLEFGLYMNGGDYTQGEGTSSISPVTGNIYSVTRATGARESWTSGTYDGRSAPYTDKSYCLYQVYSPEGTLLYSTAYAGTSAGSYQPNCNGNFLGFTPNGDLLSVFSATDFSFVFPGTPWLSSPPASPTLNSVILRWSSNLSTLVCGTFFGVDNGAWDNGPNGIVGLRNNKMLLIGQAGSGFTSAGTYAGGNSDSYVAIMSSDCSNLESMKYIGGSSTDSQPMYAAETDSGNIVMVGLTQSADFPSVGPYSQNISGSTGSIPYAAAFNSSLDLLWSVPLESTMVYGAYPGGLLLGDRLYVSGGFRNISGLVSGGYPGSEAFLLRMDVSTGEVVTAYPRPVTSFSSSIAWTAPVGSITSGYAASPSCDDLAVMVQYGNDGSSIHGLCAFSNGSEAATWAVHFPGVEAGFNGFGVSLNASYLAFQGVTQNASLSCITKSGGNYTAPSAGASDKDHVLIGIHRCPSGSVYLSDYALSCTECANGTYATQQDATSCDSCVAGRYCTNGVATDCVEPSYCPSNSTVPQECPQGYVCTTSNATATLSPTPMPSTQPTLSPTGAPTPAPTTGNSRLSLLLKLFLYCVADYTVQWIFETNASGLMYGNSLAEDQAGNFYVVGYLNSNLTGHINQGSWDAFILKVNASGQLLWSRQFGNDQDTQLFDVAVDSVGDVVVCGSSNGDFAGVSVPDANAIIMKWNGDGASLWNVSLGNASSKQQAHGLAIGADDAIYISGITAGPLVGGQAHGGQNDIFVAKFHGNGSEVWRFQTGSAGKDSGDAIAVNVDGSVVVAGLVGDAFVNGQPHGGNEDVAVFKLSSIGDELWRIQLGSSDQDYASGVTVDADGNAYVTGCSKGAMTNISNQGEGDVIIVKLTPNGNVTWIKQVGSSANECAVAVTMVGSEVVVTGFTLGELVTGSVSGTQDVFLMRFNSSGSQTYSTQIDINLQDAARGVVVHEHEVVLAGHYFTEHNSNDALYEVYVLALQLPTSLPTPVPTLVPTVMPTLEPTVTPTAMPTLEPTFAPTASPSLEPTSTPTEVPTLDPTVSPTSLPTADPTTTPSSAPTSIISPSPTPLRPLDSADVFFSFTFNNMSKLESEGLLTWTSTSWTLGGGTIMLVPYALRFLS